jgi:hypothetical protein
MVVGCPQRRRGVPELGGTGRSRCADPDGGVDCHAAECAGCLDGADALGGDTGRRCRAALYGTFVVDFQLGSEVWRAFMLMLAAVLWLVAVPWLHGRSVDTMRA